MKHFTRIRRSTELVAPTLIWQRPDGSSVDVAVPLGRTVTIGRAPGNTLIIDSPFVAETQASVRLVGGECVIQNLDSAKGTRVNRQPIETHTLAPGDVIDIGDQVMSFVDRATRRREHHVSKTSARGAGKILRLGLAAVMTGATLAPILWLRIVEPRHAITTSGSRTTPTSAPVSEARVRALAGFLTGKSTRVDEVTSGAARAGVNVADALYDEAQSQARAGRFFEAAQLYTAVLRANPKHPTAQQRQDEVLADLDRTVTRRLADADRQSEDLQWDAAVASWISVVDALPPADPRVARARAAIEAARPRLSRASAAL